MRRGLALSIETAEAWGEVAKTLAAVGGIIGGIWALVSRLSKRWRARHRQRGLEAKAIRYLLDAQRHTLYFVTPVRDSHYVSVDEMARQKALIDEVRDELWVADGHESAREAERFVTEIGKVLTRTQAIRAKTEKLAPQDMFKPEDVE